MSEKRPAEPVPMPESPGVGAASASRTIRGVLCVKCEHLNAVTLEECEFCRAHLWVKCHECGAKNRRVNIRCDECNRRLHKGRTTSSRSRSDKTGFNWWVIGMVVGGIVFMMGLLFFLSRGSAGMPRLW